MFKSQYTSKEVDWRHRVIEKVCENKAKLDKKLPLPAYFWRQKKWGQYWAYQASLLKPILEHVDYISIFKALVSTQASSFANPKFKQECWRIFKETRTRPENEIAPMREKSMGSFVHKKTNLDLL